MYKGGTSRNVAVIYCHFSPCSSSPSNSSPSQVTSPAMGNIYGYVPPTDYLLSRAVDKGYVPTQPTDPHGIVDAVKDALYDILVEAQATRRVRVILVRAGGKMANYALVFATKFDNIRASDEEIERLKKVLGTEDEPSWHWRYSI